MFFEAWLLLGIIVSAVVALIAWNAHLKRRTNCGYQWKPEQDYDVVQRGESSMTPPFPHMVKRDDKSDARDPDQNE